MGNYCSPNTNCIMDYERSPQCFASSFFFQFFFFMISSLEIEIVENLAS